MCHSVVHLRTKFPILYKYRIQALVRKFTVKLGSIQPVFTVLSIMPWLLPFLYTVLLWTLWKAIGLLRNVRIVRSLGLPTVVQYYDPHPILLLLWVFHKRLVKAFNSNLSSPSVGGSSFDKQGNDVFFKVYPSSIELIINDPECAANVLSRRNDFIKLAEIAGRRQYLLSCETCHSF